MLAASRYGPMNARAAGLAAEEVEVGVARCEDLDTVSAWKRQLCCGWLGELDRETHDIPQKLDHRLMLARGDAQPAQT
jgi:hypothetical protein